MADAGFDPEFDLHGFAQRAREAMAPEKVTAFAARAGLPQATVSKLMQGEGVGGPRIDIAAKVAAALDVSLDWLVYGRGDGPTEPAFVQIPRYDATLAAGYAAWNEGRRKLDDIPFTLDFLTKRLGRKTIQGLGILTGRGDSMWPTIADGALLLVDEEDKRVTDGVFAFLLDGDARVKRLRRLTNGIQLISDNPIYEPETILGEGQNRLSIIGPVLWVGQMLRG